MRTELKLIREDVHRITLELKERMLRVEKLQNKYECISSKSRGLDDGGEPKSQAYYVIKAAQVGHACTGGPCTGGPCTGGVLGKKNSV